MLILAVPDTTMSLNAAVRAEALPLMATSDYRGLGEEARRIESWARMVDSELILVPGRPGLRSAAGAEFPISPRMAEALARLNEWYALLPATRSHPITPEELRRAALSSRTVARVREIFEQSIAQAIPIEGRWVVAETGGEASIDTAVRLWEARDPSWSTVGRLVSRIDDPAALARLYDDRRLDVQRLDDAGLLRSALGRFQLHLGSIEDVRNAVATIAKNAATKYSLSPESQLDLIVATKWRGRYVGRWHTHAPHYASTAWAGGEVPSFEDMENAVRDGQFLTVVFQPDGFDIYDASGLSDAGRVDLSLMNVVRYRSRSWRRHFQGMHASLRVRAAR